jgi:hypothetical protein
MAYQLLLRSPTGEHRAVLDRPLVVGRDPSCDVVVESARVSRRHAEFFTTPQGVAVKDLGSRNGVIVNGTRVEDATLTPGDRVLIGDVTVTVSVTGATAVSMPPVAAPADVTMRPPMPPLAPPPPVPPPFQAPAWTPPAPSPAPAPYGQPAWAAQGTPQAPAGEDKTRVLPKSAAPASAPQAAVPAGGPAGAGGRASLASRVTLGGRLTLAVVAVSVATFVVTAVPMYLAHGETVRRGALARAATIARSVAVENGAAIAAGQTLSVGVQIAVAEPGVREALVIGSTGRVLAPVDRMGETIQRLDPFGPLSGIQGLQTADLGGEVLAVSAVESAGRTLGWVWIRLDPSYAGGSAPVALYLFAAFVCGLAVGVGVAFLVRRALTARLIAFATDIDLAAGGQLEVVTEPFGLPRLAESVNFILGRLRMAPQPMVPPAAQMALNPAVGAVPAAGLPVPGAAPLAPAPPPVLEREGRLVLDAAYLVKEATPGAVQLLRLAGDSAVGRHVLEAVTEPALVNAIIDGTADLGAHGSATRRVELGGGAPAIELSAQRTTDGAIHITVRRLG